MSSKRNNKRSSPALSKLTSSGPPPSHPLEHSSSHRQFLIRSLDRCDAELAAVAELNRTLHDCKTKLRALPNGQRLLLDLGEGRIKLALDERSLVLGDALHDEEQQNKEDETAAKKKKKTKTENNDPEEEHADDDDKSKHPIAPPHNDVTADDLRCVDFLLRLKLRRKLLNRLARRLHRLAVAMDGTDITPSVPPKFGDLRLFVDPKEVERFGKNFERQREALERMNKRREQDASDENTIVDEKIPEEAGEPGEPDATADAMDGAEEERTTEAVPSNEDAAPSDTAATQDEVVDDDKIDPAALREYDYQVLQEYNDAYEKEVLPSATTNSTVKYTVLDKPYQEDYHLIRYGAGIGAAHRSMSSSEKEVEWRRWQTALLQRIPDQPTMEELGLQNRVFYLKERRALLEKQEEDKKTPRSAKKKKNNTKKKTQEEDETVMDMDDEAEERDDDAMDVDEAEDDNEDEEYTEEDKEEEEEEEEDASPKKKKRKKEEDTPAPPPPPKITKFMSLSATPSFHEQDKKRLHLIHADLMATSITNYARRRVEQDTLTYNHAFRRSNDLYVRKMKAEAQLNAVAYEYRVKITKMTNDFSISDAIYRSRWKTRKEAHERQRAASCMPSYWNKVAVGTPLTAEAARGTTDPVRGLVGRTLADMIDGVVMRTTDPNWKDTKFDEPYERPPTKNPNDAIVDASTGETMRHRQDRIEQAHKKNLISYVNHLATAEDERKRAWRRMMKTKQEFDIPHQHVTTSGGRRTRVNVDSRQLHLLPLPPLGPTTGSSGMVATPSYAPSTMPTYMPPPVTQTAPSPLKIRGAYGMNSASKYSAARMMERVGSDGTVAPASDPKKNKDGLYQRPAGRSRKGMDWDAFRGIWVPSSTHAEG